MFCSFIECPSIRLFNSCGLHICCGSVSRATFDVGVGRLNENVKMFCYLNNDMFQLTANIECR
jgi:hypothetical protein